MVYCGAGDGHSGSRQLFLEYPDLCVLVFGAFDIGDFNSKHDFASLIERFYFVEKRP